MSTITPEGNIAAWLVGQNVAATNTGSFDGTSPTVQPDGSLLFDGSHYTGSLAFNFSAYPIADQIVDLHFYAADPGSARVEFSEIYGDGTTITTLSLQVVAYNSTQFLAEGYGYTTDGAQYPGGFNSVGQGPAYYAVFSLTPLTAQDNAYNDGTTVPSFDFPSTGNTPIPEPSSVTLIAVTIVAVVAARAVRSLRGMAAAA